MLIINNIIEENQPKIERIVTMIKAYAYLRVSGKGQVGGHGFKRQIDTIKAYCRGNGYHIEQIFQEQVSGTKDESDRPEFKSMVAKIMRNGVDTIIVESLDRLARQYRIQEQLLIYLASKGITLIATNTGENVTLAISQDPMKKALIQIQGIFAELDKSLLVKKLRKSRDRVRKEKGRCEGPRPYGQGPAREHEEKILKRIQYARRRVKGHPKPPSYQSIADKLNEDNIKTRQGKQWTAALVRNVFIKKKK
jgi:DNA invertase Pin-like site-specific DNA recombinase